MKGGVAAILGAARTLAHRRACRGPARGRDRRGRGVPEPGRGRAGARLDGGRGRRDRADRPHDRDRAQGLRLGRGRSRRAARRTAAGRDDGRDAILRMGRVLPAWSGSTARSRAGPSIRFLGTGSLHASLVEGGRELSSYPDRCALQIERRLLTGEPAGHGRCARWSRCSRRCAPQDPRLRGAAARSLFGRPAVRDAGRASAARAARGGARRARAERPRGGATFWTDAAILGHAGIPSVVFGPGGAGLHGLEEHVRLDGGGGLPRRARLPGALLLRDSLMGSEGRPYRTEHREGFEILVGKGDARNDTLTFGVAEPRDFWLHVSGVPGSHVVVRNPETSTRCRVPCWRPRRRWPPGTRRPAGRAARSRCTCAAWRTCRSRAASRPARCACAAGTP